MPDEKVINRAITTFEQVFPLDNIYIILLNKKSLSPRFVNEGNNVFFLHYNSKKFLEIVRDTRTFSHIIFHSLSADGVKYLNKMEHSSIYWIAWGADLYSGLLEQRGYQLYKQKNITWKVSSKKMPCFVYYLIVNFMKKRQAQKMLTAVRRVRYFVPDSMYDEYPLLLLYYPELSHLQYKNFFYYPIDVILGPELLKTECIGQNIMVGNSSSITGNHFFVFEYLTKLPLLNKKVIVPLSYGNVKYQKLVLCEGRRLLKDNFEPILNFMPLEQYNKLMLSARIFIYGNLRQEAVGNILIALYVGGKVFLDTNNPLLQFYKSKGLVLFDLNKLSEQHLNTDLSDDDKIRNKEILMELYSEEKLLSTVWHNF
jgi:hypothetical protein